MFLQYRNKIIALFSVVCLLVALAVVPVGAVEASSLVTDEMIEYLEFAPSDGISTFSDTSAASLKISSLTVDATPSLHAVCSLTGAGAPDSVYRFLLLIMDQSTSTLVHDEVSEPFTAGTQSWSLTFSDLTPGTPYSIGFFLVDGSETLSSVSAVRAFDTPPAGQSVGNEFFSSFSHHLAVIVNSLNNNQTLLGAMVTQLSASVRQNEHTNNLITAIYNSLTEVLRDNDIEFEALSNILLRLRYIEDYVDDLVPSAEESALKTATAESMSEFTETFWSDEGGGFGRNNITESGFVLNETKEMFDTGVSVSDFFGLFGSYSWGNWFSVETRNDLDTVSRPALLVADDEELSTYDKNLQEIQQFVGGD